MVFGEGSRCALHPLGGELLISVQDVYFRYPGAARNALHGVDWQIPRASMSALLGHNGAGKSTLLRLVLGRLTWQQGVFKRSPDICDPKGSLDLRTVGILPERAGLYHRLSVLEYLDLFARLFRVPDRRSRIHGLVEALGIAEPGRRLGSLSQGTRQKVHMARCLIHDPRLVLLDEPTANLDPLARVAVWELLQQRRRESGLTVLVTSHVLGELERNCSHVGFLRDGHMLWKGKVQDARKELGGGSQVRLRLGEGFSAAAVCAMVPQLSAEVSSVTVGTEPDVVQWNCAVPDQVNPILVDGLVKRGVPIAELTVLRADLEDVYRTMMERKT